MGVGRKWEVSRFSLLAELYWWKRIDELDRGVVAVASDRVNGRTLLVRDMYFSRRGEEQETGTEKACAVDWDDVIINVVVFGPRQHARVGKDVKLRQ